MFETWGRELTSQLRNRQTRKPLYTSITRATTRIRPACSGVCASIGDCMVTVRIVKGENLCCGGVRLS